MVIRDKVDPNKFTIAFNCVYVTIVEASSPEEAIGNYLGKFKAVARSIDNDEQYLKLSPPMPTLEIYSHRENGEVDA